MPTPFSKQRIMRVVTELPDGATLDDAIDRLIFLRKVEVGLEQADAGQTVSLDEVLDEARSRGESRIKRRDGSEFIVRPAAGSGSPLDVEGVETGVSLQDVLDAVREGREREGSA